MHAASSADTNASANSVAIGLCANRSERDPVIPGFHLIYQQTGMRVHFGLGQATKIDFVQVLWPSGLSERFENLGVDSIHDLKEGTGAPVSETPTTQKK